MYVCMCICKLYEIFIGYVICHFLYILQLASCDSEGSESLVRRFRVENGEQVEKDEVCKNA